MVHGGDDLAGALAGVKSVHWIDSFRHFHSSSHEE